MKRCSKCGIEKPLDDFYRDSRYKNEVRHVSHCKSCKVDSARENYMREYMQKYIHSEEGKKKIAARRRRERYMKKYGLTLEQVEEMHKKQENKCAICGKQQDLLNVDHCHDTGAVRELLCSPCNSGLGHFKDNTELLKTAIEYLKKHKQEVI